MSDTEHQRASTLRKLVPALEEPFFGGAHFPHGAPPERLYEIESQEEIPWELLERIRGLVANAMEAEGSAPGEAAMCWHEAGRLLDRRARRPGEAWLCHSAGLAVDGDHKPARDALRRLARRCEDGDLLIEMLARHVDQSSDPLEASALLSEKGVREARAGRTDDAIDSLREAAAASDVLIPHLIKLGLAARENDEPELADSLRALAHAWSDPEGAAGAQLILALLEERLGRVDEALDRLRAVEHGGDLTSPALWAKARLSMRTGDHGGAAAALEALSQAISDPPMRGALDRLRSALATLSTEDDVGAIAPDAEPALTWDLHLLAALTAGDREAEAAACSEAADASRTPALIGVAMGCAVLAGPREEGRPAAVPEQVDATGPYADALAAYLGVGADRSSWAPGFDRDSDPVGVLHHALTHDDPQPIVDSLAAMREKALDLDEQWDLAVAEAAVLCEQLGNPERALKVLRSTADRLDRTPLPSLIRQHDRHPGSLADLAQAEALNADETRTEALLLAWAGHHLKDLDPQESESLHRRALELDPTCRLSLAALERHSTDHATLAASFMAAASAAQSSQERARNLVRAGVHHLATGRQDQSLELFGEALELLPDDRDLWWSVIRLACTRAGDARRESMDSPPFADDLEHDELLALGTLGLTVDPLSAVRWFEKALETADGDDPVGRIGLTEALLAAGRWSVVSGSLLDELRDAESPEEEALVYARMADIDARFGEDPSSALLSRMSLEEKLPGHRPTLGRLAFHFARQGRFEELVDVLASLSQTLADDTEAAALATAAWQMSKLDLGYLRQAVARDPAALLELVELEARTADAGERHSLLAGIVEVLEGPTVYLSRLADAEEAVGNAQLALEMRQHVLAVDPESIFELHGLERAQRSLGDFQGVVDTLMHIAAATRVEDQRTDSLLQAAQITRDQLGSPERAAAICLDVLTGNPANEEAYRMGRELLEQTGDLAMLDQLVGHRIAGATDGTTKHALLLELADIRLSNGDRQSAKIALGLALELYSDDRGTRCQLAYLHREDGDWAEAIEHLMEAARLAREPEIGIEIFFALGELYMDHSDRKDLAEKSFVKVLGWDRSHFPAMERLAELYGQLGNWTRSAQALERLMMLASDPPIKVEKMVALAGVLETRLDRAKDAENLLGEARRVDPGNIAPIEALATMYARQRDSMALNVLLDQALAQQTAAAEANPDHADVYGNIMILLTMKAEDQVASLAAAAIRLVGGAPPVRSKMNSNPPEATWEAGARAGDPTLEDFVSPKQAPAGLRGMLRSVEEPIARMLGATAKQLDLSRDARLDRKHPLNQLVSKLAPAFGIKQEPLLYTGSGNELRVAPGSPPALMVPSTALTLEDEGANAFVATTCLVLCRAGLGLATLLPEDRLRRLIAALVRLCVPSAAPMPGIRTEDLEREVAALREIVPERAIAQIQPLAFDCNAALEHADVKQSLLSIAHRAGFISAGSLTSAIEGLRAISGQPAGSLSELPGAGPLMAFVFSKDHLEVRQRMGL